MGDSQQATVSCICNKTDLHILWWLDICHESKAVDEAQLPPDADGEPADEAGPPALIAPNEAGGQDGDLHQPAEGVARIPTA